MLESENQHDKFAIVIVLKERIVVHVPKNLNKIFHQVMEISNCTILCQVTGKRVNHGASYGFETPVQYRFIGAEKAMGMETGRKEHKKVLKT